MNTLKTKLVVTIALLVILISSYNFLGKQNQTVILEKTPLKLEMIRSGDLVFRQGRGFFSELFSNIGDIDSIFSHVGIVYKGKNDVFVIHTEANEFTGVGFARIEPLSSFISNRNSITYDFYRVKDLDNKNETLVLETALKYVAEKIPFDINFNLKDNDKLYCSELVYKAYKSAGISIIDTPAIIQLPGFSRSEAFKAITIGQLMRSGAVKFIQTKKIGD